MPTGLKRYYGNHDLHFITGSCYQRRPLLGSARNRDLFLFILEETRQRYRFVVYGYVVMPEHIHLLLGEPECGTLSTVMQVLKQRVAARILDQIRVTSHPRQLWLWRSPLQHGHVWQKRFYDFNVWTERKRVEKLRYMHRNPVQRGLVLEPQQWRWSSYLHYASGEAGPVLLNERKPAELKMVPPPAAPVIRRRVS